jgi:hypothetical protein
MWDFVLFYVYRSTVLVVSLFLFKRAVTPKRCNETSVRDMGRAAHIEWSSVEKSGGRIGMQMHIGFWNTLIRNTRHRLRQRSKYSNEVLRTLSYQGRGGT